MTPWLTRGIFVLIALGGGLIIGTLTAPGDWYAALNKPWFNPPNWIFAPVWTLLYVLIAFAGWRSWEQDRSSPRTRLWFVQMGLNFLWSPTFFAMQQLWLAFAIIVLLLTAILAFIRQSWSTDQAAAAAFLPYAAWVAFATLLNLSLAVMN